MKKNIFDELLDLLKTENIPFENGILSIEKWEKNLVKNHLQAKYLNLLHTLKFLGINSIKDFIVGDFDTNDRTNEWRTLFSLKLDQISVKHNFLRQRKSILFSYLPMQQIAEEFITAIQSNKEVDFWSGYNFWGPNSWHEKHLALIKNYLITKDDSEINKILLQILLQINIIVSIPKNYLWSKNFSESNLWYIKNVRIIKEYLINKDDSKISKLLTQVDFSSNDKKTNSSLFVSFGFLGKYMPITLIELDNQSFKIFQELLDYLFIKFLNSIFRQRTYNNEWILYNYTTDNFICKDFIFNEQLPLLGINNGDKLIVLRQ